MYEPESDGKQISFTKEVASNFFNCTNDFLYNGKKVKINVCHVSDPKSFEEIELQPATDYRFSSRLNSFLAEKGQVIEVRDILYIEKLVRSYCVQLIKPSDTLFESFDSLINANDRHYLSFTEGDVDCLITMPTDTENISDIYRPYITAIKSKPFLLLAGISGTGKSRIVRELARACWDTTDKEYNSQKPRNFEMIQVKPNWHDSSELIGYVSRVSGAPVFVAGDFLKFVARAWEEPNVPYFLCLDEMNLAPVEQYFAEYLSVVESRKADSNGGVTTDPILKKSEEDWYRILTSVLTCNDDVRNRFLSDGICIPKNLIVIGTVNMDETTFSFSRKVLDRAMTIEMNEVDLKCGLTSRHDKIGKLSSAELIGTAVEGVDIYNKFKGVCDIAIEFLEKVNSILEGTPFKIAYRTRNEFLLYVVNNLPYNKKEDGAEINQNFVIARALDEITNMKILSRIEGDETKVSAKFLESLEKTIKEGLEEKCNDLFAKENPDDAYKSISLAKLDEMKTRLSSGYTSFWS